MNRYGPHTDYMGYTILRADPGDWRDGACNTGGLEVWLDAEEKWAPVIIPPEHSDTALVVNAGDLFQRWTNDKWKSALHRVSNPAPGSAAWERDRFSIVFFSGPMDDVLIETISGAEDGHVKYAPVRAGDYLLSKISPTAVLDSEECMF
jgi:isopenicillin N synthase-like dioxygenase